MKFKIIKSFHDYKMIYVGTGYNRITLQRMRDPIGWHSVLGCITRDAFTRKLKFENVWRKKKLLAEINKMDAIEIHTEDMKQTLIRNGIFPDKMYWNPPWAQKVKESDIKSEPDVILFVGNLMRGKGLHLLLRALKNVKKNYKLNIAGDGYQKEALQKYAIRHKINAVFLGYVPKEKLADLYQSSLFVVFPSILEPFGFVGVEAMSYKRPIVAFDSGGLSEIIQDNVNGYLVKPFDINKLAERIEYFLENPEKALQVGEKGYEIFLSKFTVKHHMERLRKKLLELEQ
jgi:glycosyltransferase involved in cell wall biosynthesis